MLESWTNYFRSSSFGEKKFNPFFACIPFINLPRCWNTFFPYSYIYFKHFVASITQKPNLNLPVLGQTQSIFIYFFAKLTYIVTNAVLNLCKFCLGLFSDLHNVELWINVAWKKDDIFWLKNVASKKVIWGYTWPKAGKIHFFVKENNCIIQKSFALQN